MSEIKKIVCALASFGLCLPLTNARADLLGRIESYSDWDDVTNQPSVETWSKTDGPNPVPRFSGELAVAPADVSVAPHTGSVPSDFRNENQYNHSGGAADYNYHIDADDFRALDPSTLSSGTVDRECWTCPDTWGNNLSGFTGTSILSATSFANGNGDIHASIGLSELGNQNSPEARYIVDGNIGFDTELEADSGDLSIVPFELNLLAMTSELYYENIDLDSNTPIRMKRTSRITNTKVETSKMDDDVNENDEEVSLAVTAQPVPNPSSLVFGLAGLIVLGIVRRRRLFI